MIEIWGILFRKKNVLKILDYSWEYLEQISTATVTYVKATYVMTTFVHIRNILAVKDPILTKLLGRKFFGGFIFVDQWFFYQTSFDPIFFWWNFFCIQIFRSESSFKTRLCQSVNPKKFQIAITEDVLAWDDQILPEIARDIFRCWFHTQGLKLDRKGKLS